MSYSANTPRTRDFVRNRLQLNSTNKHRTTRFPLPWYAVSCGFALGMMLPTAPALSLPLHQVTLSQLSGMKIYVWPGHDTTLNFVPANILVTFVHLGNPGRFALASNGSLCPVAEAQKECVNTGATVLYPKLIDVKIPGFLSSPDGSTQLSLILQFPDKKIKVESVELLPGFGKPLYGQIDIVGDPPKLAPLNTVPLATRTVLVPRPASYHNSSLPTANVGVRPPVSHSPTSPKSQPVPPPTSVVKSTPQPTTFSDRIYASINDANAAVSGLIVADRNKQVTKGSSVWKATQTAIIWLRRGYSREDAASRAGLRLSVLEQIIAWGRNPS